MSRGAKATGAPAPTLEQALVGWRGDAEVLRRLGHVRDADIIEQICGDVSSAAEEYLRWLSEEDAMLRSNRSQGWLRSHFPEWEQTGHARRHGRGRYYRMLVIPVHGNLEAAAAAGRVAGALAP